ncbi:MAG: hypothetical protein V5804_12950 [Mucilaginibacter sp.]|uniref:hypothetical protein n=1 Tax=Mucilaginibacter sp. TaxID=1882438 RepID=UPI0034E59E14
MFTITPLRDKIIKMILNNPVPDRNTDIINPFMIWSITFFFGKYQSVLVNELYKKGLVELHGDVELFMQAKKISDTKYLKVAASITKKGMAYYKIHIQKEAPVQQEFRFKEFPQTKLRLVL